MLQKVPHTTITKRRSLKNRMSRYCYSKAILFGTLICSLTLKTRISAHKSYIIKH